ncbi:Uncharacterised protein [Vibrio cholerae]|nr:Uncharacterised protein [Vibrio cholerae]
MITAPTCVEGSLLHEPTNSAIWKKRCAHFEIMSLFLIHSRHWSSHRVRKPNTLLSLILS